MESANKIGPKKILIDCDPGIDDALAIALAQGSPDLEVVGLTSVGGNVNLEHTTDNALRLAEFYGMTGVPVARGTGHPLVRSPREASDVHGASGLGSVVLPNGGREPESKHAVDFIIDTLAAAPGEISLTAVGPLTNIALALRKQPRIAEWAREFVIMGGSYTRGNHTPAAEFNIAADPEAAAVVFQAPWRPVMLGLDLTLQARATAEIRDRFRGLGRLESELLDPILDFYRRIPHYALDGPAVHDVCAVAYVIDSGLLTTVPARVDVETHGEFTAGMTVTDFRVSEESGLDDLAEVATTLDSDGFWKLVLDAYQRLAATLT